MKKLLLAIVAALLILSGCNDNKTAENDYCVVKGTVIGQGVIKDGVFEIHPEVTSSTHVYLYEHNGYQLKDFILEPGTIFVKVDATDEYDYETGAKVS